ncbi:MAG TPA: prolyl oligopeptidase family serine peptidase [Candidatus Hydrogenedentes bacterium]|nr:prolyl oligopeptidase family serine peptidase [Candidatus Hydrogenedentota bacterium]
MKRGKKRRPRVFITVFFWSVYWIGTISAFGAEDPKPLAQWNLDEGEGTVANDSAGKHPGAITGAEWVACGAKYVLSFAPRNSFVSAGTGTALGLTGQVSVELWAYPFKRPDSETGLAGIAYDSVGMTAYADGNFYFYIGSGANKCYTPMNVAHWNHVVGTFDGETLRIFLNGELKHSYASQFKTYNTAGEFVLGRIASSAGGSPGNSFNGALGGVRVYGAALPEEAIKAHFEAEKSAYRRLEQGLNRIVLRPYYYFDTGLIRADIDFGNYYPLTADQHAVLTLRKEGEQKSLAELPITEIPDTGVTKDALLTAGLLDTGKYRLQAAIYTGTALAVETSVTFDYPMSSPVPSPVAWTSPPLAEPPLLPAVKVEVAPAGGLILIAEGKAPVYVESSFSYPNGGENTFAESLPPNPESTWKVDVEHPGENEYRIRGTGAFYAIERTVTVAPARIAVRDTIHNVSQNPVGIILSNHLRQKACAVTRYPNPAIFMSQPGLGVGLVALDDVYQTHVENFQEEDRAGLRDARLALDADASYTLEWAIYLNGSGEYYDFINAVRKDEGYIRTIEGNFAFVDRRIPPSDEFVRLRNLKYASIGCLGNVPDDPGISVEGIEFMAYPKECALLKDTFKKTQMRFPNMKVMFHVAHSLYATETPELICPDSRTLDAEGKQTDYGGNNVPYYLKYFSKEHVDAGCRWYIYYPARDNQFGQALLNAADYMMDELGVNGIFEDGLAHGYGGVYSYDRWDGHSADIDPKTKTIVRKCASVNLMGLDVLVEMVRKFNARGGVVIANSYPGPRTLNRENIIYGVESGSGDLSLTRLHLAPTVIALGDPGRIKTERDVYEDTLAKLKYGALYFFYSEGTLTRRSLASEMYPITVEEIGENVVKGTDRIIACQSGVYGWPGDRSLHFIRHFDGRGVATPHANTTTVDAAGVRTNVELGALESVVIEKIPVMLQSDHAVNVRITQYDEEGVKLEGHSSSTAKLLLQQGAFEIKNGAAYEVRMNDEKESIRANENGLEIALSKPGELQISIKASFVPPDATFSVTSTLDGQSQPCLFVQANAEEPRPLLVALHPWSQGFNTFPGMTHWQHAANIHNWHYLQPHFRGPNKNPEACASPQARQDVLDAVDYVLQQYKVDPQRIYLTGCSGGGHMVLTMAAHAPERWAAVSAWCPITDLAAWHAECTAAKRSYAQDLEAVCGGVPGISDAVNLHYRTRSPLFELARAAALPLDINAGLHDGYTGSVPVHHTLDAYNVIAEAQGAGKISAGEIATLAAEQTLRPPAEQDETYGRVLHLRRTAGPSRVTIFEGGHEGDTLAETACQWLEKHQKPVP